MTKKHDPAATPHQRAQRHLKVTKKAKTAMTRTYAKINPAAVQREIQALTQELLTLDHRQGRGPLQARPTQAGIRI